MDRAVLIQPRRSPTAAAFFYLLINILATTDGHNHNIAVEIASPADAPHTHAAGRDNF